MMIKALLRHSIPDCINTAYRAMREKDKVLKWKVSKPTVVDKKHKMK